MINYNLVLRFKQACIENNCYFTNRYYDNDDAAVKNNSLWYEFPNLGKSKYEILNCFQSKYCRCIELNPECKKITFLIPLPTGINEVKTPLALIKCNNSNIQDFRVKKYKIKNEIYYSNGSLILKEDLTPLLVITIQRIEGSVNTYHCIINKDIFSYTDVMSTYILKKLVPALSDCLINSNINSNARLQNFLFSSIEFKDLSNFFGRPNVKIWSKSLLNESIKNTIDALDEIKGPEDV